MYVPAHTRGPRTQWIAPEMLDTAGNGGVAVNAHLQSPSNPKVFAVGPCNSLGEPAMIMKYEAQCLLVAKNVKALIKGAALRAHNAALGAHNEQLRAHAEQLRAMLEKERAERAA